MDEMIYIVEDDEGIRELYEGAFEGVFLTKMFENGKDFFRCFEKTRPSLIILDIMLPDMDGYTILTKIREMDEKIPVIIVSAKSDEISAVKGLNKGADDYMTKPFSVLELIARVKTDLIELIKKDGRNGDQAIELMMVAKYLERIGDHAVNVAEWTKYNETGVHQKF